MSVEYQGIQGAALQQMLSLLDGSAYSGGGANVEDLMEATHDNLQRNKIFNYHFTHLINVIDEDLTDVLPHENRVHNMTPEAEATLIDPNQPTIAIRTLQCIAGDALLGLAAQRMRADGEKISNVIYVPEVAYGGLVVNSKRLYTQSGVLLDTAGDLHAGFMEQYRPVDATHSCANDVFYRGVKVKFINTPQQETMLEDKTWGHSVLRRYGIPHAEALASDITAASTEIPRLLQHAKDRNQSLVVKPTDGQCGNGVLRIGPSAEIDATHDMLKQLYKPDELLIIEPWLESLPLTHPTTGIRMDWNIRGLVVGGQPVGSYARVGTYGMAVNVHRGAEPHDLGEVLERCGLSEAQQQFVEQRLSKLYKTVASIIPANIIGFDIILGPDLQPRIIELNGERSGGMKRFIDKETGLVSLDPAIAAMRALHNALFRRYRPNQASPVIAERWCSTGDIIEGLKHLNITIKKHRKILDEAVAFLSHPQAGRSDKEKQAAAEFAPLAAWHGKHTIENGYAAMQVEPRFALPLFLKLFKKGRTDEAYDVLAAYSASEPCLATVQLACAQVIQKAHKKANIDSVFALPEQKPNNAELFGRTLFYEMIARFELDERALSLPTIMYCTDQLTAMLEQPTEKRKFPDINALPISAAEKTYLKLFFDYIAGMAALHADDQQTLAKILRQPIEAQPHGALGLLGLETQHILRPKSDEGIKLTEDEKCNLFLASLHCDMLTAGMGPGEGGLPLGPYLDIALTSYHNAHMERINAPDDQRLNTSYLMLLLKANVVVFEADPDKLEQLLDEFVLACDANLPDMPFRHTYRILRNCVEGFRKQNLPAQA